jgi:mannosyltransferase OCH1-like enzyme
MGIPKIMHFYWGGSELPQEFEGYREGWRALLPSWEIAIWTDRDLPKHLYNWELFEKAEEITPQAPWQLRSDLLRYELLLRYGGVWMDYDYEPQKPIDSLCEGQELWGVWEVPGVWLNNSPLGCAAGHPLMMDLIKGIPENIKRRLPKDGNTLKTGPQFFTPLAIKHGIHCYPKEYFLPYLWNELHREGEEFPDSYAIHHWAHRREMTRGKSNG